MTWTLLGAALLRVVLLAAPTGTFMGQPDDVVAGTWPVTDPVLVSEFRLPVADWAPGHRGIDLAATAGTEVRAMADGVVAFSGSVAGKPVVVIRLTGEGSRRLTYEPVLPSVAVGTRVSAGDVVGRTAPAGGHCGGPSACLHVGLRTASGYLDPTILLRRRPAVLKPM
jgi:murein DD-endopeptidase MepM/ murein hydrolase activator NlpD